MMARIISKRAGKGRCKLFSLQGEIYILSTTKPSKSSKMRWRLLWWAVRQGWKQTAAPRYKFGRAGQAQGPNSTLFLSEARLSLILPSSTRRGRGNSQRWMVGGNGKVSLGCSFCVRPRGNWLSERSLSRGVLCTFVENQCGKCIMMRADGT
ncbi:hypothetical protein VTI74DRAFT_5773 [Chaetomium olivicolor]